jgi:hypothetical protein
MNLLDIQKLPLLQTRTIAEVCKRDADTHNYIVDCIKRFYSGDYGTIPPEDTEANNWDLQNGCGHILARYPSKYNLQGDIYIEAHFDEDLQGNIDANNTLVMYRSER